jgi:Protein of unknown function (DUF1573)
MMLKTLFAAAVIALTCHGTPLRAEPSPAGAAVPPGPPVAIEPERVDLGILRPGESSMVLIRLRNLGAEPLSIRGSATSCACTAINLTNTTIPAGEAIEFAATLTPKAGLGEKHEQIRIVFDGWEKPFIIDVDAEVSLPIRVTPSKLDARQALTGVVQVQSQDGKPFTILAAAGKRPDFVDFNPARDQPRDRYQLRWDLSGYDQKTMPGWWVIETEWTKPLRPQGRRWVPSDDRFILGIVKAGRPVEITAKLRYPLGLTPPAGQVVATSGSSKFTAELVKVEAQESDLVCTIRITPNAGWVGLLYGPITVTAPEGFSFEGIVIGRLVE